MPLRLRELAKVLRRHGAALEERGRSRHYRFRLPNGDVFPVKAHNGMRSEISDVYIDGIAKAIGVTKAELLRKK